MDQPRAPWTFGGVSVVALLALAVVGAAGAGALVLRGQATVQQEKRALLQVVVTDGTDARLWLERVGQPPRAMPLSCDTAPGSVALRVARRTADGAWRQDSVGMELRPGQLHLVPIGGQPVRVEAPEPDARPRELPLAYPFPGVIGRARDGKLGIGDSKLEPLPVDTTLVASPPVEAEGWLPSRERLLVAVNPFLEEIRIRVSLQHADKASDRWQECTLPGLGSRVFALGTANGVQISCALAADGAALGESRTTPPAEAGRTLLYTVGGSTVYRWFGSVPHKMPPVPVGEWAELPKDVEVRPRLAHDVLPWLLVARRSGGPDAGLAPVVSLPLAALRPAGPVQARADVTARELALPPELRSRAVTSVAAAGGDLWGIVDGVVHDLRAGKPLHAREPELAAQMAATPHGLVLITRAGRLATLRDGKVVPGAFVFDPTFRIAPAVGNPPAVWLYGGRFVDALLAQPLDGSPASAQSITGGGPPAEDSMETPSQEFVEETPEEGEVPEEEVAPEGEEEEAPGEGEEEGCAEPVMEEAPPEEAVEAPPGHDPAPEEHALCVTAMAAAGGNGTLFARGRRIERMQRADDAPVASVAPVLTLPAEGPDVIGLLDLDGRLMFATEECVYELRGNLVLPLVEGIGGPLVAWGGGLVVCDARSGRLYHLSGPAFLPPKGTPR